MPSVRAKPGTRCSVPLCEMEIVVRGMCWGHYRRTRRGLPVGIANRMLPGGKHASAIKYGCRRPTYSEQRLAMFEWWLREEMVTPEPTTGCLLWLGELRPSGYARVGVPTDPWGGYGHRAVLHFAGVELPKGHAFHVRHSCDNPACVNIDHLRLGTARENVRDWRRRGKSVCSPPYTRARPIRAIHCRRQHPCGYTVTANGNRYCRECARIASRRWKARKAKAA